MGRTSVWRSAAAAALLTGALGCAEQITTPGACPDYCPADSLVLVDTVLTGVVVADTSIRGYNTVSTLGYLLAGDQDSLNTLAWMRYNPLPTRFTAVAGDTTTYAVGAIDSIILQVRVDGRDTAVKNIRLLMYRTPVNLDTLLLNYDTLAAYTTAGQYLDSLDVPDSSASGTFTKSVPVAAFTPDTAAADSNRTAMVIAARGDAKTTVTLASTNVGLAPRLTYYVRAAAPNDTLTKALQIVPDYDTYARTPEPPIGTTTGIRVGDAPAARALLFFALPPYIADSVTIIRAQLALRLARPATGRPGEGFVLRAVPVLRYYGGKSILVNDTSTYGHGTLTAGDTGTVVMEIARPLRIWRGSDPDSLPRVLVLRNRFESLSLGGFEALGSAAGAQAPTLRVTFTRPFRYGLP